MDIFDQAQELERLARETALQRARSSQYWEGPESDRRSGLLP